MDLILVEKTLLSLFAAIVLAVTISVLRGKKLKLPPGPLPVPVFGNWLQVGDDLNHRNLADLAKKFGQILLLRMGQRNLVVVSSPDLAKEVLHTQGVEFGSRTRNVVFDIFTGEGQDMVFTVYGEHWRKMRRIMTVPFFTNKVVQQYRFGWEDEAAAVVEDVKKNPKAATEGIVLRTRLQLMMYNNMYRIMFDRRFESEDDPLFKKLKALNGERSKLAQSFDYNYGDFIPILRPFLRKYLAMCKEVKDKRLQLFKDYFLDERKKLASTKSMDNDSVKCAIDHILDAQKKGEINEDNVLYIVENINVADKDKETLMKRTPLRTYFRPEENSYCGHGEMEDKRIRFSTRKMMEKVGNNIGKRQYGDSNDKILKDAIDTIYTHDYGYHKRKVPPKHNHKISKTNYDITINMSDNKLPHRKRKAPNSSGQIEKKEISSNANVDGIGLDYMPPRTHG